jgi:hypothetical protein
VVIGKYSIKKTLLAHQNKEYFDSQLLAEFYDHISIRFKSTKNEISLSFLEK